MLKHSLKDFVCILDKKGILKTVFPNEQPLSNYIGKSFNQLIDSNHQVIVDDFLLKFNSLEPMISKEVNIIIDSIYYPCRMSGFMDEKNIYLFGIFNTHTDQEVLIKMMRLNSEQVNQLRSLHKNLQTMDSKVFEEITKLNSELLNSRRIIEKQNAELQRYNQLLKRISIEDALTGCYNRRHYNEYMNEKFLLSQEDITNTLALIDFNNFKQINDEFGHDAGDRLLISFVEIVKQTIQGIGEIFRIGGDEFIILFLNMNEETSIAKIKEIENLFNVKSHIVTIAYGLVSFNASQFNHEHDLASLMRKADILMYQEKRLSKSSSKHS